MKKLIVIALCAVLALSFTACSSKSPKDEPQKPTNGTQISTPFIECKTIADAEKIAGFTVVIPDKIPAGYSQSSIEAIKDEMVQITYVYDKDKIILRQGEGNGNMSGDYSEYKENDTLTVGSLEVTTKGNDGKVSVATWVNGEYTFSILSDSDGIGLDNTTISDMISSMETAGGIGGDVQIPNPYIDCETLADAEKLTGFTVTLPSNMPKGYVQKSVQATENGMVQIIYENGEKSVVIRKAKGSEDISGDYNEYKEKDTLTVDALQVSTRGDKGKVNVAAWVDGEYTYSITVDTDETGFDLPAINEMVRGIR